MKAYKFFAFAMMACAVMMTACKKDTPVTPDIKSDLPEVAATEGAVTVVWNIANIDEMCEVGYVFAGNYNSYNTDPEAMVHFEAIAGYEGWFKAVIATEEALQGKPCALAKDGTFPSSWDFQWFDAENHPIEVLKGDATLEAENGTEKKLVCAKGADVVYVKSYTFKNNPCVDAVYYDVTFNLTVTNPVPEGHVVYIVGDAFEKSWDVTAYPMEGSGASWNITLPAVIGKEFKFVVDSSWTNDQMEYDEEKACAKAVKTNLKVDFQVMPVTVYGFLNFGVSEDQVCKEEVVEGVMFIKHPWGTGADDAWAWQQMTADENDKTKFTYEGAWGGVGCNISPKEDGGEWYPAADIAGADALAVGDDAIFTFVSTDGAKGTLSVAKK